MDGTHAALALDYGPVPVDRLLSDLATLTCGQSPGEVIHVTGERPEAVEAMAIWCAANGYVVLSQDSALTRAQGACFETFTIEARRIDRTPLEQALAQRDRAVG
ncbi:MAG TPA: hypothetical protein VIC85_06325 [Ktedonobacterales bacterium]|jgi:TusA-related sulfurtransferase